MEISGLSALDPRVAATEKFISDKNIPAEQVPAFLMSMGADPRLAGLVLRYQRLKSAGAQGEAKPPQSTVAQDIEAQQQGIAAPMAPPPNRDQGVGSLPAPVMDRAKFAGGGIVAFQDGGDAGMKAEVARILKKSPMMRTPEEIALLRRAGVATEQRKQGEGVTAANEYINSPFIREAFGSPYASDEEIAAGGGAAMNERILRNLGANQVVPGATTPVNPAASAVAATGQQPPSKGPSARRGPRGQGDFFTLAGTEGDPNIRRPSAGGVSAGTGGVNEGLKILRDQVDALKNAKPEDREARYRAAGIEDMTPKQLAKIEERISKLSGDKKRDAYMALAQAGFKMAAAASKPGASLLGAFGEGASEGAKMMSDVNKEYRALQNDLEDKVLAIQRYQQERKEGKIDKDIEREEKLADNLRQAQTNLATFTENTRQFDISEARAREQMAIAERANIENRDPIRDLKRKYLYASTPKEQQKYLAKLEKLLQLDESVIVQGMRIEAALEKERLGGLGGLGLGGGTPDIVSQADAIVGR